MGDNGIVRRSLQQQKERRLGAVWKVLGGRETEKRERDGRFFTCCCCCCGGWHIIGGISDECTEVVQLPAGHGARSVGEPEVELQLSAWQPSTIHGLPLRKQA